MSADLLNIKFYFLSPIMVETTTSARQFAAFSAHAHEFGIIKRLNRQLQVGQGLISGELVHRYFDQPGKYWHWQTCFD